MQVLNFEKIRIQKQSSEGLDSFGKIILEKKIEQLRQQLDSNKVFLNMVIHDMRNPSSSIEFAIHELQKKLGSHLENIKVLKKLLEKP